MWYVIIQRILSGIFVGSLGAAAVVFVVSGIAKKREIKKLKQQAKEERKVKQKGEVQPEEQKEEEIPQIDNEDINNIKKMTLKEKIREFNIVNLIIRILFVPVFIGVIFLIAEDPLNFFEIFENPENAIKFAIFSLVIASNLYLMFQNKK